MKTLVSLSGGMDSTYLLWKLLSETTDEITALHVDLTNLDIRTRIKYDIRSFSFEEDASVNLTKIEAISSWLKANVRDFNLVIEPISTDYMVRGVGSPNNPPAYTTRYAVQHINSGTYDRICLSHEWENDGFANGGTVTHRRTGAWVAHEIFVSQAQRGRIDFTLLDMDYNQAYALSEMPEGLRSIVWPRPDITIKSKKRMYFRKLLLEGKTPQEIGAEAKAKCTLPNGKWHSMRHWLGGQEQTETTTWDMPTWPSSYEVPSSG
jgi:hypothetical protein